MKKLVIITLGALLAGSAAQAKPSHAAGLKWMDGPPGLPAGAKFAVVSGDPSKEGMFVIRIKAPANYSVPPHHHPTDEKLSLKSGGPISYGAGDVFDHNYFKTLDKGYHVNLMANMNHYVWTTAPAEVEISGMGPFQISYVNPADDPRGK